MSTHITDELKSWIGREATYTAPEELGRASIRYFAMALGDDNPLFCDAAFARGSRRHGGVIAPPTLVCETNQIFQNPPDEQRLYRPQSGRCRCPAAASFAAAMNTNSTSRCGPTIVITVTWRIVDIYERETSRAGVVIFVVSEARYTNQRGELLAVNRETNIHQP